MLIESGKLINLGIRQDLFEEAIKYYVSNGLKDERSISYTINSGPEELMEFYFDYLCEIYDYNPSEDFKFHFEMIRTNYLKLLHTLENYYYQAIVGDIENQNDASIPLRQSEAYNDLSADTRAYNNISSKIRKVLTVHSQEQITKK